MGKEKEAVIRVVLDINILLSSLLFKGELARVVELWKNGTIRPVLSKETFREFRKALDYPKFQLSKAEIKSIIEDEILPYFDVIENCPKQSGFCRDPEDDKFIVLARAADCPIITGDKDILALKDTAGIPIMKSADFLKKTRSG
jgi:putative PIN family toxin of toxin-antitoxin system